MCRARTSPHSCSSRSLRSGYVEPLTLGKAVTISILRGQRLAYPEDFGGYSFTKSDGTKVTV